MKVTKYRGEVDIKALAKRLFVIRGPDAEAIVDKVETALLRANPQLRDLQNVPEGSSLIVPRIPDLETTGEETEIETGERETLDEMRGAFDELRPLLVDALENESRAANATLEQLKSRELKALAKKNPQLAERLKAVATAARARIKQANEQQRTHEKALEQLEEDLGILNERLNE